MVEGPALLRPSDRRAADDVECKVGADMTRSGHKAVDQASLLAPPGCMAR